MKSFIMLACLMVISFGSFGDNLKKEKKALIETIKTNYETWQVDQKNYDSVDSSVHHGSDQLLASTSNKIQYIIAKSSDFKFSDFTFKICNCQAVVRFQVDQKTVSAFMEKKDGQWKLVCAAILPPVL